MFFFLPLFGALAGEAIHHAVQDINELDPRAATDAELAAIEEQLDRLGREVAQARAAYNREKKEADAIRSVMERQMAAAEHLERQMAAEADPSRKAELERSLAKLVDRLEEIAPEVDREAQDEVSARELLEMLEEAYGEAAAKLREHRSGLTRAEQDMQRAALQRDMAERRAEAARQAAGLAHATDSISMALKTMQDNAARHLEAAEAAREKARILQPARPEDDPNIAAALAAVSGTRSSSNLTGRLNAIRSRGEM